MSTPDSPPAPDDKPSAGERAKATAKGLGKEAASIVAGAVGGKAAGGAAAAGKAAGAQAAKAGAEKTAATGAKRLAADAASKGKDRLVNAAKQPQSNASTRGGLAGARDDVKAASKNLARGAASGALQGATKGGWVGAAIGAAGGAAAGLVDNKAGRNTLLRILAMFAIMSLAVTLLAGALVSATVNAFAAALSSQSQDTAAAAGAEASEIRDARAASEGSATPWQLTLWMEREKPDVDFDARAFDAELIRQIPADDDRELIAGAVRDGETGRLKLGDSDVDEAAQETAETGFVAALLALYGPDGTAAPVDAATPSTSPTATATTEATPTASGAPTETPAATAPEATPTTTGTPAATVTETPAPTAPPAALSAGPPGHLDEGTAKTAFTTVREWALAIGNTCGDAGAGSITAPASGDGSGTVDVNGLTSDQVSNVRAIIGATKTMFPTADTRWAGVVAIATAYQESTLVNIGYGDYETGGVLNPNGSPTTSIGLYQQQDSWGTREQRLTPAWATGKFLSVLRAVPGWQGMELAKAAHEVQVYALQYYDKYNQAQPLAEKLWDAYEKTSPAIPLPGDLTGAPSAGGDGALPGKSQGGVACAESGTSVGAVTGGVAYPLSLDDPYHQITDFFGPRCCVGSSFHRGVDIQGIEGSAPIFAISAGTVTESAYGSGAGNYVTVQHANGVSTSYWHMVAPSPLKVGDKVPAGQQLGTVGDTGSSFGGHLHLETYDQAGGKVNPVTTLKGMGLDLCAYKISGISSKQTCG
ncbi:M23 family metallopeptidase [Pseudoclavibacter sp. VKM Ac-2867]|uniref:M23 family metallopeptidase n=1 Tax=Pseudoclavibacter sp. VKM Ac-2867 TaxID=2783829 RepID=UPI00188C4DDD|nr:M23 family metallopeptidase [Pseudoclavibacter sp. VKM Ac-2867]MBF4459444.1 M23 family metallopeptidase [Pseudoclavibacter sp. VKM Ac-2867]